MNITRFEPWGLIDILHRDLDQIAGRRFGLAQSDNDGATVADWVPAVDIVEEKDRFVLRADMPGVKPDDINVNMENGMLTVSGERHDEKTEETQGMRRVERVVGKFYRRFNLPDSANADKISAKSNNGILEVIIPKQPEVAARRITVQSE